LAVFTKERGEPACGRAANHGGFSSPPQAAKIVRANLRIVHHFGKVNVSASPLRGSATKLNGNLKEKINFWFCSGKRKF